MEINPKKCYLTKISLTFALEQSVEVQLELEGDSSGGGVLCHQQPGDNTFLNDDIYDR